MLHLQQVEFSEGENHLDAFGDLPSPDLTDEALIDQKDAFLRLLWTHRRQVSRT